MTSTSVTPAATPSTTTAATTSTTQGGAGTSATTPSGAATPATSPGGAPTAPRGPATIALYGATGHTAGYILDRIRALGSTPILVGRNADRLRAAAAAAGLPDAEIRIADLNDHAALVAAFTGADVVISALSAFVETGAAVVAAAVAAGAHYTDTSGEQLFLQRVFENHGAAAEAAGVTLLPGITDNNLTGDLLGHLVARRVQGPAELVLSHLSRSGGNGSKGSAKTVLASRDWFIGGGYHYEDGVLRTSVATKHPELTFPGDTAPTPVVKFPQSSVLTIPRHSEVAYVAGAVAASINAHLSGFTDAALDSMPEAPDADLRYYMIVDAHGADGAGVRGLVDGVDSYRDSAIMAVEVAIRLAAGGIRPGALAPAEAFDPAEFLNSLVPHGITWSIAEL
ncbi:saccharopine dehydrogenase NADP-binding domain-containing protein [Nocardia sp. NPDC005978]|uniref:saccharopine dehydrogenase NADP-binding domain-containing protein n=1 Tax=Nocardia sp. NPDC005978 TaxID=3156725 RepID=UPI0033A55C45